MVDVANDRGRFAGGGNNRGGTEFCARALYLRSILKPARPRIIRSVE